MSQHRSALLLHALFLHAFVLVAATANSAPAGTKDECLAKPNKSVSPGEHWYYRYDGVNKRRCWYIGQAADRKTRSSTQGASLNAVNAPAPQKPAKSPVARPSPPVAAAPGAQPVRETTGLSTSSVAMASADELPIPSRSSIVSRWPEAAAAFSAAPTPTETVALGSQVLASSVAPLQHTTGIAQELPRTRPPPVRPDARAATSASAGIARPLTALLLATLAFLLMVKPMSELVRWLLTHNAGRIRSGQAQILATNEPPESLRDILDRAAGTVRSQDEPRRKRPEWLQQIARALQDLAEATETYRNGAPERIRTPPPDKRGTRQRV